MEKVFWPEYLERNEVIGHMNSAQAPLMLVVAPMGFGKSTLVHNYLENKTKAAYIWLEIVRDHDGVYIWHELCEQFRLAGNTVWEKMEEYGLPDSKRVAESLAKEIKYSFPKPFYLVLDNYQEYEGSKLNHWIHFIACEQVPNLQTILISRTYPGLAYEELRMKQKCLIIDQEALTLKRQETAEFFLKNKVRLTKEKLDMVLTDTEGWIAAVYLLLLVYLQTNTLAGKGSVFKLMKTAVFDKLPGEIRDLFMKMSLFEHFTAQQAAYITGTCLEKGSLCESVNKIGFIKYYEETETFQLHSLFRGAAEMELERQGINKQKLYCRCGEWYEEKKKFIEAVIHYQKAGDWEAIYHIIEQENCFSLHEQAPQVIDSFFQESGFQNNIRHEKAYLGYLYTLLVKQEGKKGYQLFEEAREYYLEHYKGSLKRWILGELKLLESFMEFKEIKFRTECIREAYGLLDGKTSQIYDGRNALTYGVPGVINLFHNKIGSLEESVRLEKEYTGYYMQLVNGVNRGWDELYDAEYYYTTGDIQNAARLAGMVWEKSRIQQQLCVVISSFFLLCRCSIFLGHREAFDKRMKFMQHLMAGEERALFTMDFDMAKGYLYGILGRVEEAAAWIKDFALEGCNTVVRSTRTGCLIYGMVLIQRKLWIQLEALAEEMAVPYGSCHHVYVSIHADIYLAISSWHLWGRKRAVEFLEKALKIAEPDGIVMPFAEYACHILPILDEAVKKNSFAKKVLENCNRLKEGLAGFCAGQEVEVLLSKREKEIIKLAAMGCKNSEIAKSMGIAVVTVEKSLTGIYRKLNVKNRWAAIEKLKNISMMNGLL